MLLAASALATSVQTAHAIGPISVALSDLKAETVACPEGQRTMTLGARPYVVPPSALSCYTLSDLPLAIPHARTSTYCCTPSPANSRCTAHEHATLIKRLGQPGLGFGFRCSCSKPSLARRG